MPTISRIFFSLSLSCSQKLDQGRFTNARFAGPLPFKAPGVGALWHRGEETPPFFAAESNSHRAVGGADPSGCGYSVLFPRWS